VALSKRSLLALKICSVPRILKTMQRNIHAKDPQAINSAVTAVIAVARADVRALAQAGRIVVR
jgi:hypothetical protein